MADSRRLLPPVNDVDPLWQSPNFAPACLGLRREAQRHAAFARASRVVIPKAIPRPKAVSPLPLCHRTPRRCKPFQIPPVFHPCAQGWSEPDRREANLGHPPKNIMHCPRCSVRLGAGISKLTRSRGAAATLHVFRVKLRYATRRSRFAPKLG